MDLGSGFAAQIEELRSSRPTNLASAGVCEVKASEEEWERWCPPKRHVVLHDRLISDALVTAPQDVPISSEHSYCTPQSPLLHNGLNPTIFTRLRRLPPYSLNPNLPAIGSSDVEVTTLIASVSL
ncbi:hypothetical protein AAG570_012603 [Ranatra chinensis]|uniref:Uncharacterized protein n=1 Tax=Ranatra chinensis TaxID=642074 RepID=A0ABD0YWU4_9HEMI